nr:pre-rRNA-processing protein PNO1 [Andalucia godoyi]
MYMTPDRKGNVIKLGVLLWSSQLSSESRAHSSRDGLKLALYLICRRTQNQVDNCISRESDVLEAPENVDVSIREHDSRSCSILNCKLCFSVSSCNSSDGSTKMVPVKRLHILDFKRVEIQVLHSEQRNRVCSIEPKHERTDEIRGLLHSSRVRCLRSRLDLDTLSVCVHPHHKLQMVHKRLHNHGPAFLQRSKPIWRNINFAVLRCFWIQLGNIRCRQLWKGRHHHHIRGRFRGRRRNRYSRRPRSRHFCLFLRMLVLLLLLESLL